jgi:hypothetical protein
MQQEDAAAVIRSEPEEAVMARLHPRLGRHGGRRGLAILGVVVLSVAVAVAAAPWASGRGAAVASKTFKLFPNPAFSTCARAKGKTLKASATVTRGALNDTMTLSLSGFKPNVGFDLFTVQRSNQNSDGTPVSGFTNFGMAWYQSDIETDANGNASVRIQTILLDQIFGFDPDVALAPTQTLHVGFWFDSVAEAQPCSQTTLTPTPFNGEHNAGPLAFITRPAAKTGLGPLCTHPVKQGQAFVCEP